MKGILELFVPFCKFSWQYSRGIAALQLYTLFSCSHIQRFSGLRGHCSSYGVLMGYYAVCVTSLSLHFLYDSLVQVKLKIKLSRNKSYRLGGGDGKLSFHPYFDIRPHLTPKEINWYSFRLETEWTPGILNADRKMRSLENFQGSQRVETGTSSLVVQCLNKLLHCSPHLVKICWIC
jgi:hypothetical protein